MKRRIAPRSEAMLWMAITWRHLHGPDAPEHPTLDPFLPIVDRLGLGIDVDRDDDRMAAGRASAEAVWRATRNPPVGPQGHAERAAGR